MIEIQLIQRLEVIAGVAHFRFPHGGSVRSLEFQLGEDNAITAQQTEEVEESPHGSEAESGFSTLLSPQYSTVWLPQ